jgi:6-phosphogluconolactonase (cycloisomerase 2 family)
VSIAVTPATPSLAPAATQQFTATGTYASGPTQDLTSQVNWSSSRTVNATITSAGFATAVDPGATTISATLSGVTGSTVLTVTGTPVVVGLQVTPGTDTVSVGSTVSYTALELLGDGTTQPLTGTVTWASGTTATATIGSTTGIAIAAATGTSTITATEVSLTGTGSLTVQAAAARFAFNADPGIGNPGVLTEWSVEAATGAFTPVATTTLISGLQQVLVHPSGHYIYAIDQSSKLVQYDVDSTTGAVTNDTNSDTTTSTGAGQSKAAIDPTGRFIYLVNSNPNSPAVPGIYSFAIKQVTDSVSNVGALTAINPGTNPITAGLTSPTDILIDKSGTYAYVVDAGSSTTGSVLQYKIDPVTGALTPLSPVSVATGNSPFYGVIDPTNTYLYVANFSDASISVYKIGTRGLLAQVGSAFTVTGATEVYNLAIDPRDKYIYATDFDGNSVYGFVLGPNGTIGAATPNSPYAISGSGTTTAQPFGVTIDPTGVLLAVDNNNIAKLSVFKLDPATGALTAYPDVTTGGTPEFYLTFYSAIAGQ